MAGSPRPGERQAEPQNGQRQNGPDRRTGRAGAAPGEEFCARRLLARIHAYTRERQRREIEPVTARDFVRFLLRWQHVAPGTQGEGRLGVLSIVEQLQATSWLPVHGRTPSSPRGWRATGASGWTRPACRARSSGDGCQCATVSPTRPRSAAGWSRPGPPPSPWPSAMTCPGCSAPPAAIWRRPSRGRAAPRMWSTPSASTGRCSGPTSPR